MEGDWRLPEFGKSQLAIVEYFRPPRLWGKLRDPMPSGDFSLAMAVTQQEAHELIVELAELAIQYEQCSGDKPLAYHTCETLLADTLGMAFDSARKQIEFMKGQLEGKQCD